MVMKSAIFFSNQNHLVNYKVDESLENVDVLIKMIENY